MVDKINSVDATASAKKIKEIEEKDAKKVKEDEKAKETKNTDKKEKLDSFNTKTAAFTDIQIKNYAENYVNRLIKQYEDNPKISDNLRAYLMHFDIDQFKKDYPDIKTSQDLSVALYNQTLKFT